MRSQSACCLLLFIADTPSSLLLPPPYSNLVSNGHVIQVNYWLVYRSINILDTVCVVVCITKTTQTTDVASFYVQHVKRFSVSVDKNSAQLVVNSSLFACRWCRSVVKYGVRVSQVKPSNYCRLHLTSHWFSNTQQSRFLTACRHLEKLVLPPVLTLAFHSWWCETYRVIQQFWMKTCGFWGVKTYCDPPTYFHGSRPLNPPGSRPLSTWNLWLIMRVQ